MKQSYYEIAHHWSMDDLARAHAICDEIDRIRQLEADELRRKMESR